jgi:hypothetical protein
MKHFFIFLSCCLIAMQASAQSREVFFENFETGAFTTDSWPNWELKHFSTSTNGIYWNVDACNPNVTPSLTSDANKVAYITKNGSNGANTYEGCASAQRNAHFYRTVHLNMDSIYVLTFDWKSEGNSSINLKVYNASGIPTNGTSAPTGTQIGPNFYGYGGAWQQGTIVFTHATTEDRKLSFTWYGSTSTGYNPPAAVDNIRLTAYPKNNALTVPALTAGDLKNKAGIKEVVSLTVTGTLNASDFAFMRDSMQILQTLNISGATIAAYTGDKGTLSGDHSYPANEIPQNAFYNGAGKALLTTLVLPNSSYSVGEAAFRACTGLTGSIDLSKATAIGRDAFRECTGLTGSLNLSAATSIGNAAFFFTASSATGASGKFSGVTLSSNLTAVGDSAFRYAFCPATEVESLTIPAKVTSIGKDAFYGYAYNHNAPHTLTFAASSELTAIGENAFYYARYLSGNLAIPNSVTSIGASAFYNCSGFTGTLTLPTQLTSIGGSAFYGCKFTGNLTIPAGVTTIGASAFSGCSGLDGTLTLPANLTYIGGSAFTGCSNLQFPTVTIPKEMTTIEASTFSGCAKLTSVILHDGITSIGNYAFGILSGTGAGITSIDLKNVGSIGNYAFANCSELTSVDLKMVTTIGTNAFQNCTSLTSINIPYGVTEIVNNTFNGCTNLATVTLPATITRIGTNNSGASFKGCTALSSITVLAKNPPTLNGTNTNTPFNGVTLSGVTLKVPTSAKAAYEGATTWEDFGTIVDGGYSVSASSNDNALGVVTGIENRLYAAGSINLNATPKAGAFINWTSNGFEIGTNAALALNVQSDTAVVANFGTVLVHNLAVAGTLNEVADIATYTRITLTGNINAKDIAYIRDNLPNLKELDLSGATIEAYTGEDGTVSGEQTYPANTLPENAFYDGTSGKPLTALTLPGSLTAIGANALRECTAIGNALAIPAEVTAIGSGAFYNCTGLTGDLTLPAGLTSIEADVFNGCRSLTGNVVIPSGITAVGESAFRNCSGLQTLSLPGTLTSIGRFAFNGCSGLTSITALNPVPVAFTATDGALANINYASCILYVANSSVEAYKAALHWRLFWESDQTVHENIHGAGFIVTAEPNGAALGVVSGLEDKFYQLNEVAALTATATGEFLFSNWTSHGNVISTNAALNLTVTQDTAVIANFVKEHSGVVTAGQLHAVANIKQTSKITLTATSTLDARDFAFMRDQMPYLVDLDIAAASIVAYQGDEGTVAGITAYAANKIPEQSFKDKLLVSVKLPSTITLIGESAFRNTSSLAGIEIPAGVTAIGDYAFSGSGIEQLTFVNNSELAIIGGRAFENCTKLTGLNLPAALITISDYAFSGCTELTGTLTLPENVSSIGAYAFAKDDAYNSSSKLVGVVFPNSLRTIGANAFKYSKSLESINLPEGLTGIGEYAFNSCSRLKSAVRIPAGISTVAAHTFGNDSILYLELHANVSALGNWAFANNPFDSVRVYSPTPIAFSTAAAENPFYGVNSTLTKSPLLVPEGSYSSYLNANVWKDFEFGDDVLYWMGYDYGNRDWRIEGVANNPAWGRVEDISTERGMPDWIRIDNECDRDEYYYIAGQTATLRAVPAADYSFVSWTAEGSSNVLSTDAEYPFVVSGKAKLIANFESGNSVNTIEAGGVSIYPNPVVNGTLTVKTGELKPGARIAIYSLTGSLVATQEVTGDKTVVDVSHLASGSYLLKAGITAVKFAVIR